jgi:hypothetical protein
VNLYEFAENSSIENVDILGHEVIIIRVASSSEKDSTHVEFERYRNEVIGYDAIFDAAKVKLGKFIQDLKSIDDAEWARDSWKWSFAPGHVPVVTGISKQEIIDIAEQETKSHVIQFKKGGVDDLLREFEKAVANSGNYAKIVVSAHGSGSMCWFPNGHDFSQADLLERLKKAAKGKPFMLISCGQQPTGNTIDRGNGITETEMYDEVFEFNPSEVTTGFDRKRIFFR